MDSESVLDRKLKYIADLLDSGDSDEEEVDPFQVDFGRVVKHHDLRFDGDFARGTPLSHAPNPCLHIEGFGILGLPLNENEAQRLFKHCAPAYNHGASGQAAVFDVEASRITFHNPTWRSFFTELVKTTFQSLAALAPNNVPISQFRKLSLCQPGTFSDRTAKSGFATLVVLLPSCYSGGRVQVSHAGSTRIFDFAAHSAMDVCTIAWYNETNCNVDPITSGHRLALVYDLIPASSAIPKLPDLQPAVSQLQGVLRKWSQGHYANRSALDIIAIVLTRKYDEEDLSLDKLGGQDRHRAFHVRFAAEGMGYVVGLAQLQYRNFGNSPDDVGICELCEARNDQELANVTSTHININNLVDLTGLPMPGFTKMKLSKTNLILDGSFNYKKPDTVEIRYSNLRRQTNTDSDSEVLDDADRVFVYKRSVLFLFPKNQELSLSLASGTLSSAAQRIQDNPSQDKTPENVLIVNYILEHSSAGKHPSALSVVAGYAVHWKYLAIWNQVVEKADKSFRVIGKENLFKACRTFPFDNIQTTLTTILGTSVPFHIQVDLIKVLRAESSEETVTKWCDERMLLILASLNSMNPTVDDAPSLLSVVVDRGLPILPDVILGQFGPQASSCPPLDFWTALVNGLYEQRVLIVGHSGDATQASQKRDQNSFEHIIDLCFDTIICQRQCPKSQKTPTNVSTVIRALELLDLSIRHRDLDACMAIFRALVNKEGSPDYEFRNVYQSLIPQLRPLLSKHSMDFRSHPFDIFVRFLIERQLSGIGLKPSPTPTMRKIGCGCQICRSLDAFVLSNNATTEFPGSRQQGLHLEKQISASDILTSSRSRPPGNKGKSFTLVVTKRVESEAFTQWNLRQKEVGEFMVSIGNANVISQIVGDREADVCKAITGVAVFVVDPSNAAMFCNGNGTKRKRDGDQ